jgi:hypothetical protein
VLSTAPPAGLPWAEAAGGWEEALRTLGRKCDTEELVVSEGWAAGAHAAGLRPPGAADPSQAAAGRP